MRSQQGGNRFMAAFARHRGCNPHVMTYEGNTAVCGGCGARWLIKRDHRGEPTGYSLLPSVNTEALIG